MGTLGGCSAASVESSIRMRENEVPGSDRPTEMNPTHGASTVHNVGSIALTKNGAALPARRLHAFQSRQGSAANGVEVSRVSNSHPDTSGGRWC